MDWNTFLSAAGSATSLLMLWMYLGYQQKWLWFHEHQKVVTLLETQIAENVRRYEEEAVRRETELVFWRSNALKSTNIAEKVMDKAVTT